MGAKFTHNSVVSAEEPDWSSLALTALPQSAFAEVSDPTKRTSWKYPHHWVKGGSGVNSDGVYTDGTLYLHRGGLSFALAAAHGARSGALASDEVVAHLKAHQDSLRSEKEIKIVFDAKAPKYQQIVYGEVYAPNQIDTDGETMSAADVQKMAWDFLSSGKVGNIDVQHNLQISGCKVVESFVARPDDPDFTPGSWVLGTWCPDEIWEKVLKGELNGYSFYGTTQKYPAKVLIEVTKQLVGTTELSTIDIIPYHQHNFVLNMDNKGRIVSGKTDVVLGHSHVILMGTATEVALDHSHRVSLS